jgi:hypothetical protein
MAELGNPRYERFAQELAAGNTADGAYEAAGYRKHRGNAALIAGRVVDNDTLYPLVLDGAGVVLIDLFVPQAGELRLRRDRAYGGSGPIGRLHSLDPRLLRFVDQALHRDCSSFGSHSLNFADAILDALICSHCLSLPATRAHTAVADQERVTSSAS